MRSRRSHIAFGALQLPLQQHLRQPKRHTSFEMTIYEDHYSRLLSLFALPPTRRFQPDAEGWLSGLLAIAFLEHAGLRKATLPRPHFTTPSRTHFSPYHGHCLKYLATLYNIGQNTMSAGILNDEK